MVADYILIFTTRGASWPSPHAEHPGLPRAEHAANPRGGGNLPLVSDLTLLLLAADIVALLLLGAFGRLMPSTGSGLPAAALCGLGALLCLPVLILRLRAVALVIPIGPPGLSLHLALDPLSTIFLAIVLVAGTAVAAFQAASVRPDQVGSTRMTCPVLGTDTSS